jgi:hypothetical protein
MRVETPESTTTSAKCRAERQRFVREGRGVHEQRLPGSPRLAAIWSITPVRAPTNPRSRALGHEASDDVVECG